MLHFGADMLLRFEMRSAWIRVLSQMGAKFRTFNPLKTLRGGVYIWLAAECGLED